MTTAPSDPSERTVTSATECTNSPVLPAGDSIAAAVSGINIAIAAAADEGDELLYYGGAINKKTGVAIGITGLALFGASATYGFIQMSRCNALRREVNVETAPPEARSEPPPPSRDEVADERASASALLAPISQGPSVPAAEPQHQLPSWSALRRYPMKTPPPSATSHSIRSTP